MTAVGYTVDAGIAVLDFGNPPVNALSHALRRELAANLEKANADPGVKALVLIGRADTFSAGADIREFNSPAALAPPALPQLIDAFENSPKPVIAAIAGNALGGGLELALGCHYRVVHKDARLGLPEVKLGLLPGAGGTQRLPRLLGIEGALNVILAGEPLPAKLFAKTPLIDRLADGDLLAAAKALASEKAGSLPPPRVRDRQVDEPDLEAITAFARNTARAAFPDYPAPLACIDAVAAAALPFAKGVAEERRLFGGLINGSVSRALRHLFFAERAAARIDDVPETTPQREIRTAAVIGAGTMGAGISINFLNAGIPVQLLEVKQPALDAGIARIRDIYAGQVKKGKLTADKLEARMALLKPTLAYADIAQADIVIEAVFEDLGVKEQVFRTLDETMKSGAILATNTSTLDVDRIAGFTTPRAGRDRYAFLQPCERHEAARGRARRRDGQETCSQRR